MCRLFDFMKVFAERFVITVSVDLWVEHVSQTKLDRFSVLIAYILVWVGSQPLTVAVLLQQAPQRFSFITLSSLMTLLEQSVSKPA